jgi:hypothetical protein
MHLNWIDDILQHENISSLSNSRNQENYIGTLQLTDILKPQ